MARIMTMDRIEELDGLIKFYTWLYPDQCTVIKECLEEIKRLRHDLFTLRVRYEEQRLADEQTIRNLEKLVGLN